MTGAFSYSGRAIAARLQADHRRVRTLTGHPERGHDQTDIEVRPRDFGNLPQLRAPLEGVTTLYNTYWVRFAHQTMDHSVAVEDSRSLFHAARRAGVQKIVHVSILHPSPEAPYPYFRGKALVERALAESGLPFAVLRPSVRFDEHGVLLNNIAWLLRHLPIFGVGGGGNYRIRPIHVDDLAALALAAAAGELRTGGSSNRAEPSSNERAAPTHGRHLAVEEASYVTCSSAQLLGVPRRFRHR